MINDYSKYSINLSSDSYFDFDVVVIGSGMGGSTTSYALTKKGLKVLLIEKGNTFFNNEQIKSIEVEKNTPSERLNNGRWPTQLDSTVNGFNSTFFAPLGCGTGGSTLIYGGALERLSPLDFQSRTLSNGTKVEWPYSYADLQPYYQLAESLFNVHGTPDTLETDSEYHLNTPAPLNATDQYFFNLFEESGLHPYQLHVALPNQQNIKDQTGETKVTGALENCLLPALSTGNLQVAANCEVVHLEATSDKVTTVVAIQGGETHKIPVDHLVLAAGAYFTPVLLLRSVNSYWPKGLANKNDLVGRNLMFHASDYIGIWSTKRYSSSGAKKTLAFRDFYSENNAKLGELQSTGKSAEMGYILFFLRLKLDTSIFGKIPVFNKIARQLVRIPAYIASIVFREASIFASIIEDYPHLNNRVLHNPNTASGMHFEYTIDDDLKSRIKRFRQLIKKNIKTRWVINFSDSVSLNYGHPCGTCRAGRDSNSSVIDTQGKAHGIDNLYITDSSFMPTSGGTNPSLTVAANALRTADNIIKKLTHKQ